MNWNKPPCKIKKIKMKEVNENEYEFEKISS